MKYDVIKSQRNFASTARLWLFQTHPLLLRPPSPALAAGLGQVLWCPTLLLGQAVVKTSGSSSGQSSFALPVAACLSW